MISVFCSTALIQLYIFTTYSDIAIYTRMWYFIFHVWCHLFILLSAMDVKALLAEIGKLSPGDKLKVATAVESKPDTKTVSQVQLGNGSQARLSLFSGDDAKGDVSFELWKFEVRGLVRDGLFPNAVVLQSIRRSLRGTAADILLHLGEDVKVDDLLSKLEKVFGNTLPPEAILEEFYSAKQRESEKVAMWVCRLETILSKLPVGTFTPDASKGMLRTKFYSGLRLSVMRNALRHSFDGGATYEDLLVAARVAEREHELENASARVNQATAIDSGLAKKMDQVLSSLEKVQTRLDKLESRQNSADRLQPRPSHRPFTGICYLCNREGHPKARCPLNSQPAVSRGRPQAGAPHAPNQHWIGWLVVQTKLASLLRANPALHWLTRDQWSVPSAWGSRKSWDFLWSR